MADRGFNGVTLTWEPAVGGDSAAALGPLTNISVTVGTAEVQVSGAGDAKHLFEAGIEDLTLNVEIVGCPTPGDVSSTNVAVGDKGNIVTTWAEADAGATSASLTNAVCTSVNVSGSLYGPVTSSLAFRPSVA